MCSGDVAGSVDVVCHGAADVVWCDVSCVLVTYIVVSCGVCDVDGVVVVGVHVDV